MNFIEDMQEKWQSEILEQFDNCAQEYNFPMLNNVYFHNADVRLTVFRNNSEWLIIFEEIALDDKQNLFINSISAYGNKIENPGTQQAITVISDVPGKPMWDEKGNFILNPWNFEVVINGKVRKFTPSQEDYSRAKIDVESAMKWSAKIFRLLTFIIPNEFFIPDNRLLQICNRTSSNLEKFIQLEDWHHPDIADDEMPSQNKCLQNLALAIAINNINIYDRYDNINTHWSNWEWE